MIERDLRYIGIALAMVIVIFIFGVLSGMVLDPFMNSSGIHQGQAMGMQIAFGGLIIGLLPVTLFLLMLFLDTWKIEATPELREKYGKSIKWAIFFFFFAGTFFPVWLLLLLAYFVYQKRYDEYMARRFTHG